MSPDQASLYTIPSTWINETAGALSVPYRRIVGISQEVLQPNTIWAVSEPGLSKTQFTKQDATAEKIELDEVHMRRLISFFNRYFVEQPTAMQEDAANYEDYNCHRFGYWMRGVPAASRHTLPDAPDHIVAEGYEVKGFLPAGKHGVTGSRTDYALAGAALHSLVGLGRERDDCLEVIGGGGFMGIDTYDNVLAWYNQDQSVNAKLYSI